MALHAQQWKAARDFAWAQLTKQLVGNSATPGPCTPTPPLPYTPNHLPSCRFLARGVDQACPYTCNAVVWYDVV